MTDVIDRLTTLKGDRILVKKLGQPEKRGSFYVPASARDQAHREPWRGEVVLLGDDVDLTQRGFDGVRAGATVFIDPVAADCPTFEHRDATYVIVRDEDLLATFGDER